VDKNIETFAIVQYLLNIFAFKLKI